MDETFVSTTKGINIQNLTSEPNKELPEELSDVMKKSVKEKVDGFIFGEYSAKIIKKDGVPILNSDSYHNSSIDMHKYVKTNTQGDEHTMNNKDSMDTLFRELKADLREREERSRREISDREERFEKQMDRYTADATARENRFREDFKEREERIANSLDNLEEKMVQYSNRIETMKSQNFWGNIALFVGMLAIVITLIIVV